MQKQTPQPSDSPRSLTDRMVARAWSTPEMGIVLGTLFLIHFLVSLIAGLFPREQFPVVKLFASLLIYAVVTGVLIFILRCRRETWPENYGMGLRKLRWLAASPLLYVAVYPFLLLGAYSWHLFLHEVIGLDIELRDLAQTILDAPAWLKTLYIVMAVLVTPIYEEVLFRGTLFPYIVKHGGPVRGVLMVSVLFAALHFHLSSALPLVMLSIVLCLAYRRTGSLWICIGMHAIFNAVSILALHLT